MSKQEVWVCDGCGKLRRNPPIVPVGWTVTDDYRHLCEDCKKVWDEVEATVPPRWDVFLEKMKAYKKEGEM
jgi:hypothetical protein